MKRLSNIKAYVNSVPPIFAARPIDGVSETIRKLKAGDFILGVVSSGPRQGIDGSRQHYQFLSDTHLFIHGAEDLLVLKPDPGVFDQAFAILGQLGIHQQETIYVGDGLNDYQPCRARGLTFIAVTSGFTSKEQFFKEGLPEELILESFNQLPKFLGR